VPNTQGGASIISFDKSCTIPDNSQFASPGAPFVNFVYASGGTDPDGGGDGLDRTKEGYVEIIEMASFPTFTCTSIQVTHVGGVPFDCANLSDAGATSDQRSATGGLFGGMTLINVSAGTDYTEDAVALQHFNKLNGFYQPAGSVSPQLTDAFPQISTVFAAEPSNLFRFGTSDLGVYISRWPTPTYFAADTVSAVLMHDAVMNEFVLDPGTKSGTDWVVTFPTKRFYVRAGTGSAPKLFQRNFNKTAGACDDITLNIYDREERTTSSPVTFSPPPPTQTTSLCWEANVVTFNNSNVLGSKNTQNINTTFQSGWLRLGFTTSTSTSYHKLGNQTNTSHILAPSFFSTGLTKTYLGLPVVGFAVQSFTNGTLIIGGGNVLANYGGNFVHKTTTTIIN
jgi:hypothetical protein